MAGLEINNEASKKIFIKKSSTINCHANFSSKSDFDYSFDHFFKFKGLFEVQDKPKRLNAQPARQDIQTNNPPATIINLNYIRAKKISLQEFLTKQIENKRIIVIGESHSPHSFSENLANAINKLPAEKKRKLIIATEAENRFGLVIDGYFNSLGERYKSMDKKDLLDGLIVEANKKGETITLSMLNSLKLIILSKMSDVQVHYIGEYSSIGYENREKKIYSKAKVLAETNKESTILCFLGMAHASKTELNPPGSSKPIETMSMMLSRDFGEKMSTIRVATDELDLNGRTSFQISDLMAELKESTPIVVPSSNTKPNHLGSHDFIILAK